MIRVLTFQEFLAACGADDKIKQSVINAHDDIDAARTIAKDLFGDDVVSFDQVLAIARMVADERRIQSSPYLRQLDEMEELLNRRGETS